MASTTVESCPRCRRAKAESMRAWNTERFASDEEETTDESGMPAPQRSCARHIVNRLGLPEQVAAWDCDRATIARLERENSDLVEQARLLGVELAECQRELAEAHAMIADSVRATLLEAAAAHRAGIPLNLWSSPGPVTPELQAELEAAARKLDAIELPPEMLAAWQEKARKRTEAFARCLTELAEAKGRIGKP